MLNVTENAFTCYPVTALARARKACEGGPGLNATPVVGAPNGHALCIHERNAGPH